MKVVYSLIILLGLLFCWMIVPVRTCLIATPSEINIPFIVIFIPVSFVIGLILIAFGIARIRLYVKCKACGKGDLNSVRCESCGMVR